MALLNNGLRLLFMISFHFSGCISPIKSLESKLGLVTKANINDPDVDAKLNPSLDCKP